MHRLPAMICGRSLRFVSAVKLYAAILFLGNRLRFLCGNDTVAVAMQFAMKNGQVCFSLRKFLAISSAIQKIASDCGCDAVVHLGEDWAWGLSGPSGSVATLTTLAIFSETGRIWFRRARLQTPNSVSFSGLTEFDSVSFLL